MLLNHLLYKAILLLLAPSEVSAFPSAPPCSIAAVDRSQWKQVSTGTIRFSLPASFREIPGLAIDSNVRGWSSPGQGRIEYDYGIYSSAYSGGPSDSSVTRSTLDVEGWQVEIVTFTRVNQGPSFHAYWIDSKVRELRGQTDGPTLMVYGFAPDSVTRDRLLAVLPTIRRVR